METTQSCFADSAPIYALDKSEISQSVADGAPGGTISASEAPRLLSLKEALDRPEHDPPHLCNWQKNRIVEAIKEKHLAFDPVKLSKNSDVGILVCQRIWSCWASMDRIHRTLAMRMVLSWLQDRAEEEGVDGTSTLDTTRFNIRAPSDPLSPIQQSSFGLLQTKLGEEKQGNKDGQTEGFSTSPKPKTQGASVELRSVENSADESAPVPRYGAPAKATSQEPLIDRRNGDQITVWRATQDYISGSPSKQVLVAGQHYTKLEEFSGTFPTTIALLLYMKLMIGYSRQCPLRCCSEHKASGAEKYDSSEQLLGPSPSASTVQGSGHCPQGGSWESHERLFFKGCHREDFGYWPLLQERRGRSW